MERIATQKTVVNESGFITMMTSRVRKRLDSTMTAIIAMAQ
eukprot:CAMPEP_0197059450 /NCGR_PEP_ID=MMETSP1384-20130603/117552_1 /TAXON_ID=29189 /ORGANISM="Ammonia sp." /LENGTH=40 /DNA_ID= /DNA_START= /DNA_END= /DNA_ORIENTATION=